ncbi:MAG TPA: GNAT family N-acetyltransferase [Firmicutes bacterium]|nr:GNAT family N-acetyltransferase [Bacillota bacterium]
MIRLLTEADRKPTLAFLGKQPGLNLFHIGDIENYGFDSEIQTVWGNFNDTGELNGVLLRYRDTYLPYFEGDEFDVTDFKKIIDQAQHAKVIQGEKVIIEKFLTCFDEYKQKECYFCELVDDMRLQTFNHDIKVATPNDAKRILNLLMSIEEFDFGDRTSLESIQQKIEDKSGRIYYIENEVGEVICNVQTTAENSKSAMVVGVATHPNYRNLGLMSQALSKLCHDVLAEGKTLCLFYDNPSAGSVYHRLGFKSIGKWKMLIKM